MATQEPLGLFISNTLLIDYSNNIKVLYDGYFTRLVFCAILELITINRTRGKNNAFYNHPAPAAPMFSVGL